MDLIGALRRILDPLVAHTSFVLTGVEPLTAGSRGTYGFLEYHGVLNNGRIVMLGFYQRSGLRTISAEMWSPNSASSRATGTDSVAMRYKVWSYDPTTDVDDLARTIVAEVTSWLQSFDSTGEPGTGALPMEA